MKAHITFTVTREVEIDSPDAFENELQHIADEAGEYLYGGQAGDEKISVHGCIFMPDGPYKIINP